jgi:spore coat polysaccharide biosynthesis protein SpsF
MIGPSWRLLISGVVLKIVAIIQARMGSTRLPGKVLKDIEGETMLARVVNRVRRSRLIDELLVATTDERSDDVVVKECQRCAVAVFRGSEKDVLDRYFRAAQLAKADIVVRITSDCPLIDPEIADKVVEAFLESRPEYASNTLARTYPRGLDTEVITLSALGRAWQDARTTPQRTHVTPYIYEHPALFQLLSVTGDADHSGHRWTVDTHEDLELIRAIYARLRDNPAFVWRDVLALLDREPQLIELNRAIMQKPVQES